MSLQPRRKRRSVLVIKCNGCGRFCQWNEHWEIWECGQCHREYEGAPPKRALIAELKEKP